MKSSQFEIVMCSMLLRMREYLSR